MKVSSGFFAVILLLWSGASTYWYVCKIKKDCDKPKSEITVDDTEKNVSSDFEKEKISQKKEIKDTVQIVNDLSEKLKAGYTLYNFPKNSAVNNKIDSEFDEFAENLKIYFSQNDNTVILITGYTDNTGTPEANLYIGKKRAEFLKSKLAEKGIDKSKIKTSSKGQEDPVATNETEEGRNKNRRAVITLINN